MYLPCHSSTDILRKFKITQISRYEFVVSQPFVVQHIDEIQELSFQLKEQDSKKTITATTHFPSFKTKRRKAILD